MTDPFVLRWKLDRPNIPLNRSEDVHVLLTIEPHGSGLHAPVMPVPVHMILVVDVSGSMNILVRKDPGARTVGQRRAEGRTTSQVVSDVPSRREMACRVVRELVSKLGPDDWFTLVAFDQEPYLLAQGMSIRENEATKSALQRLGGVGGGETSLGKALDLVQQILNALVDAPRVRKLLLLTDGEADDPQAALDAAQALGASHRLPITALGTGECKVAFLTRLAKTTLAGSFNHIRHESEASQFFFQTLANQKNILATNASLKLWLSPDLHVREMYRTRPEILFVGDLQPDANNIVQLHLEQMERGKAYEFLFRCTLPPRNAPQRFRLAKASLTFDAPTENLQGRTLETNIVAEYAADPQKLSERSGDVKRVLGRAEVQRQVLFLQHKIDLVQRGAAAANDAPLIAKLLQSLTAKFLEFGDQAMVNHYSAMKDEFLKNGTISQDMLNRSLAASSRAEDFVVAQDLDF
jgi:hypothetical protein